MRHAYRTIVAVGLALGSACAFAEDRVIEMFNCDLRDGKTVADVQVANGKWLKFVNGKVKGGGVRSFVLTNIVGAPQGFRFADSYPDLNAWTATKAALETDEGKAVESQIEAVADCTSNMLSRMQES